MSVPSIIGVSYATRQPLISVVCNYWFKYVFSLNVQTRKTPNSI